MDTPPTSQRSQMVNSGSMPMAACSTAWSVPGHAPGRRRPGQHDRVEHVYQNARVTSRVGQVELVGAEDLAGVGTSRR